MRSIHLLALGAALAIAITACSGGAEVTPTASSPVSVTPSPSPVPPEVYAAAAQQAVQNALLRVEDLGEGWSPAPPDDDDDDFDPQLEGECAQFNEEVTLPGEIATADSGDFAGPGEREISSDASVFADADTAEAGVDLFASFVEKCSGQMEAALTQLFVDALEGEDPFVSIDNLELDVTPLFAGLFGDHAEGWRIKIKALINGQSFEYTIDQVVIRSGAVVASVTFAFVGPADVPFEDQISSVLTNKAAAADASLPRVPTPAQSPS